MLDIVRQTGLILHVGILESGRVLIVDRFPSYLTGSAAHLSNSAAPRLPRDRCSVGGELLPNTTALGKVLLAGLSHSELADVLNSNPLRGETTKSIVSRDRLTLDLEQVRRSGYATANGEHTDGLRALAVPLYDQWKSVCAAISLTGDESHQAWNDPDGLLAVLKETATDLSRKLAVAGD
jgi:DNA-binding IclR family transcriptional regulator